MSDDDIAALRKRIEELEAKATPKPQPSAAEQERATAKWIDEMHQMREGRMSLATPPSVVHDFAVLDDASERGKGPGDAERLGLSLDVSDQCIEGLVHPSVLG